MKRLLIASLLLAPLFALSQQVAKSLTASNGTFIGFYQYTPTDYSSNPTTQYPLIIFLHGIGERGDGQTNLPLVLANGIPKNIANGHPMRFFWNGKWETFLVLSPQLSTAYGDWQNFYVDEMIKYAKNNLRVDPNRIYLTGLSLGGGGVWKYASSSSGNASQLAAIAPVCGTCNLVSAANIAGAKLPVWAFHAQDDGVVGVGCTTSSIQAIQAAGNPVKPLMTLYANGGHWIWDRAYDTEYNWANPNLYEWLLGQNKSLAVNTLPVANAGPDITISSVLGTATLSGASSSDPDGTIVRYIWNKISGPSVGNILSVVSTNGITGLTGLLTAGTYVYELTVVDNRGGVSKDQVVVNVSLTGGGGQGNVAPVANAGPDQTITLPTNSVSLNGSASSDADGNITAYSWTKVSGGTANFSSTNSASTTVSGLTQGSYVFALTVTDNAGATNTANVKVTVNGAGSSNKAPIANAGPDQTITGSSTNLNGASSSDPDGSIASYNWSKLSGPTSYAISNSAIANPIVSNLVAGTYQFLLIVNDNLGLTARDTVQITVGSAQPTPPPSSQPPVARAGSDITITLPTNNVTLNGSTSSAPAGSITNWNWSKLSGPAGESINSPQYYTTTVTNLSQGIYTFQLIVKDNTGASASDTVIVTVNGGSTGNQLPVAKAGNDQTITGSSTTLDGSGSYDPDGTIKSFYWSKVTGPDSYSISNSTLASPTVNGLVNGTYEFVLAVNDANGALSRDTVKITVGSTVPANQAPVANAGPNGSITLPTNTATLNGSASTDPDGTIASWKWTRLSGPNNPTIANTAVATTSVSNLVQGVYQFELKVTDNAGASAADTVTITVAYGSAPSYPVNNGQAPVANAGSDQNVQWPANSVVLRGTSSYDPDGFIAVWNWSRISGPTSYTIVSPNSDATQVNNLAPGTYAFKLTLTDNAGNTAADTVMVNVIQQGAPVANAGNDVTINLPVTVVQLNGLGSTDGNGFIAQWNWSQVSGPTTAVISSPNYAVTQVSGLSQGTYQFQLKITNNTGIVSTDVVVITVNSTTAGTTAKTAAVAELSAATTNTVQEQLVAYPNPAISKVNLRYSSALTGPSRINVYDINGKLVYSYQFVKQSPNYDVTVPLSSLSAGIYYAEVITGSRKLTSRFVKQ